MSANKIYVEVFHGKSQTHTWQKGLPQIALTVNHAKNICFNAYVSDRVHRAREEKEVS